MQSKSQLTIRKSTRSVFKILDCLQLKEKKAPPPPKKKNQIKRNLLRKPSYNY